MTVVGQVRWVKPEVLCARIGRSGVEGRCARAGWAEETGSVRLPDRWRCDWVHTPVRAVQRCLVVSIIEDLGRVSHCGAAVL